MEHRRYHYIVKESLSIQKGNHGQTRSHGPERVTSVERRQPGVGPVRSFAFVFLPSCFFAFDIYLSRFRIRGASLTVICQVLEPQFLFANIRP